MLRTVAIVLIAANVLFFGFTRGWFDGLFGLRASGDREPERLAAQVRPESVVLLPMAASSAASGSETTSATGGARCLEAGPFAAGEAFAVEAALQTALPGGAWSDVRGEAAPQWLAYVGPFASREATQRRSEELRRLRIEAEEVTAANESGPGLALGRYDERAEAERAAAELLGRGARGARVAAAPSAGATHVYRVAAADAVTASRLLGLRLGAAARTFAACAAANASAR